jgi:hypothetical protein
MSSNTISSSKPTNTQNTTVDSHEHLIITVDNLELKDLSDLRIEQKINDHVRISFSARVPGETAAKESFIKSLGSGSKIVVGLKTIQQLNQVIRQAQNWQATGQSGPTGQQTGNDSADTVQPFFKGLVTKSDLRYFRDDYRITVEGMSYTCLLDVELRSRTYQNVALSYAELIECVLDNPKYSELSVQCNIQLALQTAKIDQLMVQHHETDWVFLTRQASQHYTGLVANPAPYGERPEFWFGVPESDNEAMNIETAFYKIRKQIGQYREMLQNKTVDSLNEEKYLFFEVNGIRRYLQIGQAVKLNGKDLFVCRVTSRNEGDQLLHDYVLTATDGLKQRKLYNPRLKGTSLTGTVIGRVQDGIFRRQLPMPRKSIPAGTGCRKKGTRSRCTFRMKMKSMPISSVPCGSQGQRRLPIPISNTCALRVIRKYALTKRESQFQLRKGR